MTISNVRIYFGIPILLCTAIAAGCAGQIKIKEDPAASDKSPVPAAIPGPKSIDLANIRPTDPAFVGKQIGQEAIKYIENDTYIGNETSLIGQVAAGTLVNGVFKPMMWQGQVTGLESSIARGQSASRKSVMISKKLASEVDFLGFLSGRLQSDDLASLSVTDLEYIRAKTDDPQYSQKKLAFLKENPDLNKATISLFMVTGVVHKLASWRSYEKQSGSASGSYGVKVGGEFYSGNEYFDSTHIFGLDFEPLKRSDVMLDNISKLEKQAASGFGSDAVSIPTMLKLPQAAMKTFVNLDGADFKRVINYGYLSDRGNLKATDLDIRLLEFQGLKGLPNVPSFRVDAGLDSSKSPSSP